MNAALAAQGRPPVILGRETSYIAVLIDDLVTRGVDEPYRLFTSRSEFRLTVRQDNALRRLSSIGLQLELYDQAEDDVIARRLDAEAHAVSLANATSITPETAAPVLDAAGSTPLSHAVRISELAKRQGISLMDLFRAAKVGTELPIDAVVTSELEMKYAGYFERERVQADRIRRLGEFVLAPDLPYLEMQSLSFESRQKLATAMPATLAQAARLSGVSPSDVQNLVIEVERGRRSRAATLSAGEP